MTSTVHLVTRSSLVLVIAVMLTPLPDVVTASDERDIVLRTSHTLDGRGSVLENRDIVVRGSEIADVVSRGSASAERVYDLTALTVLPGTSTPTYTSAVTSTRTANCTSPRTVTSGTRRCTPSRTRTGR